MKIVHEFKEFAVKGNVVDMAVGIIIGAAFGKIVSSMVADLVMPPIGLLIGGVNFSELGITLRAATADSAAVVFAYGKFIQTTIDFLLIALVIFFVIKGINTLKRREAPAPAETPDPAPTAEQLLLTEIRDLLKQRS